MSVGSARCEMCPKYKINPSLCLVEFLRNFLRSLPSITNKLTIFLARFSAQNRCFCLAKSRLGLANFLQPAGRNEIKPILTQKGTCRSNSRSKRPVSSLCNKVPDSWKICISLDARRNPFSFLPRFQVDLVMLFVCWCCWTADNWPVVISCVLNEFQIGLLTIQDRLFLSRVSRRTRWLWG